MVKLQHGANFLEIGKWIIQKKTDHVSRENIEDELRKKFDWSDNQVFSVTDPYFVKKKYDPTMKKTKRGR